MSKKKNEQQEKSVDIHLPYHKQGEDFDEVHDRNQPLVAAFELMVERMRGVVAHLNGIIEILKKYPKAEINAQGMTHSIFLSAPSVVIDELIAKNFASLNSSFDSEADPEFLQSEDEIE